MQQLCAELGAVQSIGEDGQPSQCGGLLSDVRQLLTDNKGRDDNMATLHGSVNGLMSAVQENLQQSAELRNAFSEC